MSILRRYLCIAMLAIGLLGWWGAVASYVRMADVWRGHIHDNHIESGPLVVPKDKLQSLSKENLVFLVGAGERVLGWEYRFSLIAYRLLLITTAVAFFSSVFGTIGLICVIRSRWRSKQSVPVGGDSELP